MDGRGASDLAPDVIHAPACPKMPHFLPWGKRGIGYACVLNMSMWARHLRGDAPMPHSMPHARCGAPASTVPLLRARALLVAVFGSGDPVLPRPCTHGRGRGRGF